MKWFLSARVNRLKNRQAGGPGPGKTSRSMIMSWSTSYRLASAGFFLVLALGLAPLAGCGRKIGDECRDLLDCNNEDNIRSCDLSQPGGYCTIDGCDETSCPGEAVCVRFFPAAQFLTKGCDPDAVSACDPQELCVRFPEGGRCASRATEKRNCMLKCDDDGDCRDDYACRTSNTGSSLSLTGRPGERVKYCAPR
jgi:hypothetical protein